VAYIGLTGKVTIGSMEPVSVRHALARGAVHATIGLVIVAALFLFPRFVVLALLAAATIVLLSLDAARLRLPSLKQWCSVWLAGLLRQEEENDLTGASYLLLGSLITLVAFPRDIACLAIVFLSLGDPTATVIGTWRGRIKLWDKSLEGYIACLIICLLVGVLVAAIWGNPPLVVAIIGAIFASIFEGLPLRLNDNLTIPIGSALAMTLVNIIT
jgi:dolichol kinase